MTFQAAAVGSSTSGDFDADLDAAKAAALDKAQRLVLDQASSLLQTADAISELSASMKTCKVRKWQQKSRYSLGIGSTKLK